MHGLLGHAIGLVERPMDLIQVEWRRSRYMGIMAGKRAHHELKHRGKKVCICPPSILQ